MLYGFCAGGQFVFVLKLDDDFVYFACCSNFAQRAVCVTFSAGVVLPLSVV